MDLIVVIVWSMGVTHIVCGQSQTPVNQNSAVASSTPGTTQAANERFIVQLCSILGGASMMSVVLTIALVICLVNQKQKKQELRRIKSSRSLRTSSSDMGNEYFRRLMSVSSSSNLNVSRSLFVNSCNLQLGESVGQGEFGIVYEGLLRQGYGEGFSETVAVKTLKGFLQKDVVKDLLRECARMKEFDHPNVLKLKGVCLDGGPTPYIIMPFMTCGSLKTHLKENRESILLECSTSLKPDLIETQKKLLDICFQVAKGMEYLASKGLIHRDLSARNCMIDTGFVIKVADFGLSESMDTRLSQDGTVKMPWMAIESLTDGIFSEKTDVWAYGVTCWEVYTAGQTPYPGVHPLELSRQLETGYRMEKPLNAACTEDMYSTVLSCWKRSPGDRPRFSELIGSFSGFLSHIADYFDFVLTNPSVLEPTTCDYEVPLSVVKVVPESEDKVQ